MVDASASSHTLPEERAPRGLPTVLAIAALASIGAGALHAAAVGMHAEHRQASLVFVVVALFQLGWGVAVIGTGWRSNLAALTGAVGNAAIGVGWVLSTTTGIGFVDGLEQSTVPQLSDAVAAGLAGLAVIVASLTLVQSPAGRRIATRPMNSVVIGTVAALVASAAVPGLVAASSHDHDHSGGSGVAAESHDDHEAADGTVEEAHSDDGDHVVAGDEHANDPVAASTPVPYDPDMPIDLSGTPGVTPQQQARAENLIAVTLLDLPQFADPSVAEAAGFYSIRDGVTGHEHYLNWDNIRDDRVLDPDYPESLVYQEIDGKQTLVSAMYMLRPDDTLDDVPDVGGPLMQWHIHNDLCFTDDPVRPVVAGLQGSDGCSAPTVEFPSIPMIHVWIVPHECGPFAALDGVGAGQIASGEARLCDTAHGGH